MRDEGRVRSQRRDRRVHRRPRGVLGALVALLLTVAAPSAGQDAAATLAENNRRLSEALQRAWSSPTGNDALDALDAAEAALETRAQLVGNPLDPALGPLVDQQRDNLATTRRLVRLAENPQPDPLAQAIALAKVGSRAQARTLGFDPDAPAPAGVSSLSPSAAALTLLARSDVKATTDQVKELLLLDGLPEPARGAFTRFIDAFLVFQRATKAAYRGADLTRLRKLAEEANGLRTDDLPAVKAFARRLGVWPPQHVLKDAGLNLGPVFAARAALLEATLALRDAFTIAAPVGMISTLTPVCYDLVGVNTTYSDDCIVLVDVGGADTYNNNAGGNNSVAAAALVDLGGDDDQYTGPRDYAVNGGAWLGAGFLLDAGGDDDYVAGDYGTDGGAANGGGYLGSGFLLDVAGDDYYEAQLYFSGGALGSGTNGGGGLGAGFLLDTDGDDVHVARGNANGAAMLGSGFLLNVHGYDRYSSSYLSSGNGGGYLGSGFLVDLYATDLRQVIEATELGCPFNGASLFGTGFVFTLDGSTDYWGVGCSNGAASGGIAFLVDAGGGDDYYSAWMFQTNGGAALGMGFLLDSEGNDQYYASSYGTNGGGREGGAGLLADANGIDSYGAGWCATNGGGVSLSCLNENIFHLAGTGLLLDGGGTGDGSWDSEWGGGTDRTICPKDIVGCQKDIP